MPNTATQSVVLSVTGNGMGFRYVGASRFLSDYGVCRLGGYSGHAACYAGGGQAYVFGFKGFEGIWEYMPSTAKIARPAVIPSNPANNYALPHWELVQSVARLAPTVGRVIPSHPCVTDDGRLAWSGADNYAVSPDQSQPDAGYGSLDLTAHNPTHVYLSGNGHTHNRTATWCLPVDNSIRNLHSSLAGAEWFQGACITSGAATASFGPSLFAVSGSVATPLMYFPPDHPLPLQRGNDIPSYPGSGVGAVNAAQGPTSTCLIGHTFVCLTACALGPIKRIGGDSVDAELFEWRLLLFRLADMVPVLNGSIDPWSVRHYAEIPVYITPAAGWPVAVTTDLGEVSVSPPPDAIELPYIPGVGGISYATAHGEMGLMYDFDKNEMLIIQRGADTSNVHEPPPVVYHCEVN